MTTPTAITGSICLMDKSEFVISKFSKSQEINLIEKRRSKRWTEVDGLNANTTDSYTFSYYDILSTASSIFMRAIAVCISIKLAYSYYEPPRQLNYFIWTAICIVMPMFITTLIHANMCYQDGKFGKGFVKSFKTLWLIFLSSFMFRYWNVLVYSIKCKRAQLNGCKDLQLKYYKMAIKEESDVAFIRLFECFLEAAPQKILQISIVLNFVDEEITPMQIIAICSYFGSMAWCLAAYHRYNRYSQIDKSDISTQGFILQLGWHFCTSVSRTLCIAFVASLFPLWTIVACLSHAFLFGFVTFIVERPVFASTSCLNFLFCLILGVVYLFTYISVKDASTKYKYLIYYIICFTENIICIALFMSFASSNLFQWTYLFYSLCAMALVFYIFGLTFMIIYYTCFHPKKTARKSKLVNNN
ncbi:XK-related protein 6-like [Teleopsis dalmanni]|uniref:XK-related protein 6-like n=1 Tax=Teleopsis dalmanni TaxID=139649 RepID=UPI0018CF39D1|nr:XK-related protein 6-like [Teleopsis dalmanni]XP_037940332.1 XK-related protein 6-like [Teleopsis dalmanni]